MASIGKKAGSQMYNVEKGSIDLKVFLDHEIKISKMMQRLPSLFFVAVLFVS